MPAPRWPLAPSTTTRRTSRSRAPHSTQAKKAALAETGGGRVTETEVNDEESKYEVEVTLDDGTQVDVQLDEHFKVVGTEADGADDDEGADDEREGE